MICVGVLYFIVGVTILIVSIVKKKALEKINDIRDMKWTIEEEPMEDKEEEETKEK